MQHEEEEMKATCDGFLRKPITRGDLAAKMRQFCKVRPGVGERSETAAPAVAPARAPMALDPIAAGKLPALLLRLPGQVERWRNLVASPSVSEVARFARDLRLLAAEWENLPLRDYAEKLAACAHHFDVVAMELVLQEFAALADDLGRRATPPP
jgi:hypothetical protein